MNGQKARSGYSRRRGFEGGQMPLIRRVPKRGFTNIFKEEFNVINLSALENTGLKEIKAEDFFKLKLARKKNAKIKILGNGELKSKIKVYAHKFSKSAIKKIEKNGGEVIILEGEKN
jgi:large subunit ribosomal protein L15